MKVKVNVGKNMQVEIDEESEKKVFKALSRVKDVLGHTSCGACESQNVRFRCRGEDEWLEMVCLDCYHTLPFGVNKGKEETVYAKTTWASLSEEQQKQRADEEAQCVNGYLPNGGWFKFKGKKE